MSVLGGTARTLALVAAFAAVPDSHAVAGTDMARHAQAMATRMSTNMAALVNDGFVVLQEAVLAPVQDPVQPDVPATPAASASAPAASAPVVPASQELVARPNINPYDRDLSITVPLNFNRRVLGELPVLLTRDDRFIVDSAGFKTLIAPLLTPEAQVELEASLAGIESFPPEEINATGIQLDYDPEQLAVLVLRIDPAKRAVEYLFQGGEAEAPEQGPEPFSAFLNSNIAIQRRQSTGDVDLPSVFLNGAVRYKSLVFEADFQGREDIFSEEYEVDRRYARFVYDQPESFRRWYLGDLDPETRGRQGFVELGGAGVARQRRRFDSFRNNVLSGNRQLILQEEATVRVLRNGLFVREFRLDAGQYDVSNLPLTTGSNDITLEIQGLSGRTEIVGYNAYLDSIDLEPGDYEYAAYLGLTNEGLFGSPDYSDGDLAFTGYYRKAFENRPAIGVGLQASEQVQAVTGQTQFILRNGSRVQFDASASNSSEAGAGYAYAVSYDHVFDTGDRTDSWTVIAEYVSEDFSGLGNVEGQNPTSWSLAGSYARRFSTQWVGNISANYRVGREDSSGDAYSINATSSYRFDPNWSVQVGVEYSDVERDPFGIGSQNRGFGATVALVWTPRFDRRGEVRYNSARDSGSVRFQQSAENRTNSFGYSLASTYDNGSGSLSGQVDYTANRFDATLTHAAFGRDFSNITEEQVTSLRVGTSIATAGGRVAIGRNINDSFAIVYPHPTLREHGVIVGDSLEGGQYTSRSGALGPALSNVLTSYINQSVRYDAVQAPVGYNVGEGIVRVRPTYKSGYAIEVGSAAFVSALGRLTGNGDKPLALISGNVRPADEPEATPQLFFTNSVGRFAIQDLEPGKRYRVQLFTSPSLAYEFTVPEDNEGLLDMGIINVPLDVPEE